MRPSQAYQSLLSIVLADIFPRQHWPAKCRFTPGQVNFMLAEVLAAFGRVVGHMFIVYALNRPNKALEFVRWLTGTPLNGALQLCVMRHRRKLGFLVAAWCCVAMPIASLAGGSSLPREAIIATFKQYGALYTSYISAAGAEQTSTREKVEVYTEGPYTEALEEAEFQECQKADPELLRALFSAMLASLGSAYETPSWTLGAIFVCQPDLVAKEFRSLKPIEQKELYGLLEFGFENVVHDKAQKSQIPALQERLRILGSSVANDA